MKPTLILFLVTATLALMAAPQDRRRPLSKDEVQDLLNSSTPSKEIIATIERDGIAFEPTDAVLDEFRKAGADSALLTALRQAKHTEIPKPLSDKEIRMLVAADAPSENIARLVVQRGIDFRPSADYLKEIRSEGAKDELIQTLRATAPRPFTKDELLQLLGTNVDGNWIARQVQQRAIDFEADRQILQALHNAGAQPPLLEAIRTARRVKPFLAQIPPSPTMSRLSVQGGTTTLICEPSDKDVPVFADSHDLGNVAARLPCGVQVTFLEKVDSPPGFDKIRYADGKEGFISDYNLETPTATPGGNVIAPTPIYQPAASYTPDARHEQIEGTVTLQIIIDRQGNVADVQETSKPLGAGLDQSATNTVKTWRFHPATRDGVPVPVRVGVEVAFRLHQRIP